MNVQFNTKIQSQFSTSNGERWTVYECIEGPFVGQVLTLRDGDATSVAAANPDTMLARDHDAEMEKADLLQLAPHEQLERDLTNVVNVAAGQMGEKVVDVMSGMTGMKSRTYALLALCQRYPNESRVRLAHAVGAGSTACSGVRTRFLSGEAPSWFSLAALNALNYSMEWSPMSMLDVLLAPLMEKNREQARQQAEDADKRYVRRAASIDSILLLNPEWKSFTQPAKFEIAKPRAAISLGPNLETHRTAPVLISDAAKQIADAADAIQNRKRHT